MEMLSQIEAKRVIEMSKIIQNQAEEIAMYSHPTQASKLRLLAEQRFAEKRIKSARTRSFWTGYLMALIHACIVAGFIAYFA
jgi:hypothetical protein